MKVHTPLDLQVVFAKTLQMPPKKIEEMFEFGEDKQGYLYAQKLRKKGLWLNDDQFRALANLVTSLDGEYVRGQGLFKVPGPAFKKPEPPRETPPTGAPMPVVKQTPRGAIAPGYYPTFPVTNIISSQFCFRTDIAAGIDELMAEINAAGHIIEPLICKPSVTSPGNVYLGPGERRLLAAKQLGMKTVPVVVDDFSDVEFDKIRLLENLARKDLTDYEVARGLDYMLRTYPQTYPTQEALANDFQKDRTWVTHHLGMLQLEKSNIVSRDTLEKMSEHQARAILSAPQEKQKEIAVQIEKEGRIPTVREISSVSEPQGFESAPQERRTAEQPTPSTSRAPEAPASKPEPLDVADFSCPVCHRDFRVVHVNDKLHRFTPVKKAEP